MSGGWEVGDLALCVDDGPPRRHLQPKGRALVAALKAGAVYHVTEVGVAVCGMPTLFLEGFDYTLQSGRGSYGGHDQSRFRKIKPDAHEGCEPEFVTLLNRIKVKQGEAA